MLPGDFFCILPLFCKHDAKGEVVIKIMNSSTYVGSREEVELLHNATVILCELLIRTFLQRDGEMIVCRCTLQRKNTEFMIFFWQAAYFHGTDLFV